MIPFQRFQIFALGVALGFMVMVTFAWVAASHASREEVPGRSADGSTLDQEEELVVSRLDSDTSAADKSASGSSGATGAMVEQPEKVAAAYQNVALDAGVWNGGQAALWDLNIIDHFRLFGAEARARGYRPEQPIKFSHITHVQNNQMECQFCHWSVAKASFAAIPEVETCMGCHKIVAGTTPEQQAEIKKIGEYYNRKEPIPWEKVHVTPDYIKFNHKRHVAAGVTCQQCHGQVPKMEVVERVSSMKMGWCVDCHRAQGSSIDCFTCHY